MIPSRPLDPARPFDPARPDDPATTTWVRGAIDRSLSGQRDRVLSRGERIVATVIELLEEVGEQFTIDDIVKRSGVARRTFHRVFAGKDDVLLAAFETLTAGRFHDQAAVLAEHTGDPVTQLHAVLLVRWRWADDQPVPLARAIATAYPSLRNRLPDAILASQRATNQHTVDAIRELRAAGAVRDSSLDDDALAGLIGTLMAASLQNRVLGLADDVATVPPDDEGFGPIWEFVRLAVLGDDAARPSVVKRGRRR